MIVYENGHHYIEQYDDTITDGVLYTIGNGRMERPLGSASGEFYKRWLAATTFGTKAINLWLDANIKEVI